MSQRRLIAPAFTSQTVKSLAPVFFQKAEELSRQWNNLIDEPFAKSDSSDPPPAYVPFKPTSEKVPGVAIDLVHWLSRASFDVLGLAGFGYHFNAVDSETEAIYLAFRRLFRVADTVPQMRGLLYLYFPIFKKIWVSFRAYGCKLQNI
jgi:cytochrome P450